METWLIPNHSVKRRTGRRGPGEWNKSDSCMNDAVTDEVLFRSGVAFMAHLRTDNSAQIMFPMSKPMKK
jgi:hypothetical protein